MRLLARVTASLAAREPRPRLPLESSAEVLLGWRVWQVVDTRHGPALASWSAATLWPTRRELGSGCFIHGTRPAVHHTCGIHAFAELEDALIYARTTRDHPVPFTRRTLAMAVGQVSCWGHTVRHTRGWRSQFAYPYDLSLPSGDRGLARSLADRYVVDVTAAPPGAA